MFTRIKLMSVSARRVIPRGFVGLESRAELEACPLRCCSDAQRRLGEVDPEVIVVDCPDAEPPGGRVALEDLAQSADSAGIACLVLVDALPSWSLPEWVQFAPRQASEDELWGRVVALCHARQLMSHTQREVRDMQRLGRHLNEQFEAQGRDMRLASSLQRKFLPRQMPVLPGVRFSVIYRPASWVSGDIYDIARLDERHVGFYVADCVGHGVAASLLTIFVKRAMINKEILPNGYRLLAPDETLARLNNALIDADLECSQFVTAAYCVLDVVDRSLHFCRAGHPYPLLVHTNGRIEMLRTEGALLGLARDSAFEIETMTLEPGQKIVLYSDGMEEAFHEESDAGLGPPRLLKALERVAHLPVEEFTQAVNHTLDAQSGSLNPKDDVTMVAIEATEH